MSAANVPLKTAPLPAQMLHLPIDDRGYVVPWFVEWVNGKPEFRSMDWRKYQRAIHDQLCWVCGRSRGTNFAFVAGPMCGVNRTSSEPPSHVVCARWSAINCPFLSNPNMVRREDAELNNATLRAGSPGLAIARNPGVTMVWITREFEMFPDGTGRSLIHIGRPHGVEWYARGRHASRSEVIEAIESGIGILRDVAKQEPGGLEFLEKQRRALERYLPV